jgi:hypothetical protein
MTERETEMMNLLACQLQHFVEDVSSNDGLVIRLGCSNSQAVGAR